MKRIVVLVFLVLCFFSLSNAQVLEFDDKFPAAAKEGKWLVMFFAPWCGHCKHMEPVWQEVAMRMKVNSPDVHVGKLDCTKHSSIASIYGVRGFPTIKFFRDGQSYDYNSARNANSLVAFVQKASGPVVEKIQENGLLQQRVSENKVLFTYVGTDVDPLWNSFKDTAKSLFTSLPFVSIHPNLVKDLNLKQTPAVLVFKDDTYYVMPANVKSAIEMKVWVHIERIPSFPAIDGSTYSKLKATGRKLAVSIFKEEGSEFNTTVGEIALKRKHPFTFCWSKGTDVINSLTYATIDTPELVVFDPASQTYYLFSDHYPAAATQENMEKFLDDVKEERISSKGGYSMWAIVKRFISEMLMSLMGFFQESPIITSLVIIIPTVVITFLCVFICTLSDDEDMNGEGYDDASDTDDDDDIPNYNDQERPPRDTGVDASGDAATDGLRKRVAVVSAEEEK